MLGAVLGGLAGAGFSKENPENRRPPLLDGNDLVNGEVVTLLAVAQGILDAREKAGLPQKEGSPAYGQQLFQGVERRMRALGREYIKYSYPPLFRKWIRCKRPKPYGGGTPDALLRGIPAGFWARGLEEAGDIAQRVTAVTHNQEVSLQGAKVLATVIALARRGGTKGELGEYFLRQYPHSLTWESLALNSTQEESCQVLLFRAMFCFLDACSFEDALEKALSLGGNSRLLGAVTGGLAQAYYGIPPGLLDRTLSYLDETLRPIYDRWQIFSPLAPGPFHVLTKYKRRLEQRRTEGKWVVDALHDGTPQRPLPCEILPYKGLLVEFGRELRAYVLCYPGLSLKTYKKVLGEYGMELGQNWKKAAFRTLDARGMLALLIAVMEEERTKPGKLASYEKAGVLARWLEWLEGVD